MNRLFRKIKGVFTSKPEAGFLWSVEDFEAAKKWAKSQDYPENPRISLWEGVSSISADSTEIIHNLNQYLGK